MKKIVMVLVAVIGFSVGGFGQVIKEKVTVKQSRFDCGMTVYEMTIDSCQYFVIRGMQAGNVLTHKGNCKRCAKIRQREHRELIEAIRSIEAKKKHNNH